MFSCKDDPKMYYQQCQVGGSLLYYKPSVYRQRGSGLGAVFGAIMRHLLPFAKNYVLPAATKYVLPHARQAVKTLANDVLSGADTFGNSLRSNTKNVLKNSMSDIMNQSGSGRPGKRKAKSKQRKIKRSKSSHNTKRKLTTKRISIF